MQKETEQYNNTTLTELVLLPKINHRQECARSSHFGLTCLSFAFIWLLLWPGRINVEHRSLWKNVSKQSKQQLHFSAQHNHENERFVIFFLRQGWHERDELRGRNIRSDESLTGKPCFESTRRQIKLFLFILQCEKVRKPRKLICTYEEQHAPLFHKHMQTVGKHEK